MTVTPEDNRSRLALVGVSTGIRLVFAATVGIAAGLVVLALGPAKYAPATGWDIAAAVLLGWSWWTIWPMGPQATEAHATREDPTRALSDVLILTAALASLAAVGFFVVQANSARGSTKDLLAATGVITVALSWFLIHTVFTLRYAGIYYSGNDYTGKDGGVGFNQKTPPRYSDFAYLAFTLGMTYQVSDTDISSHRLRATALRHALLSYLFGSVILATMINLLAGLGGRG